jgi:hypothetical protein
MKHGSKTMNAVKVSSPDGKALLRNSVGVHFTYTRFFEASNYEIYKEKPLLKDFSKSVNGLSPNSQQCHLLLLKHPLKLVR